jgi:hypothetical protein
MVCKAVVPPAINIVSSTDTICPVEFVKAITKGDVAGTLVDTSTVLIIMPPGAVTVKFINEAASGKKPALAPILFPNEGLVYGGTSCT